MSSAEYPHREITERILGAAIEVHRILGPGLLEGTYEACLVVELELAGLRVERQLAVPVVYKGVDVDQGLRIDLLVEDKVIVELKCVASVVPIHEAQLLTYLRLARKRVGLLINFNELRLADGFRRRILG